MLSTGLAAALTGVSEGARTAAYCAAAGIIKIAALWTAGGAATHLTVIAARSINTGLA